MINEVNPNLLSKIRVHFTFEAKKSRNLVRQINKYGLSNNIIFEGVLAYQALLSLYKSMRALLFPSFIESFGLPLIEAASAGIPIVVSDLPYSRDVIGEYEGVSFVGAYETEDWANAIMKLCEQRKVYSPFALSQESSWVSFFELVNQLK